MIQYFISKLKSHSRLKTPVVLQMEAAECGAAALGIILAYYEKYIPLEELRIACGVSRDGSKAINMLKAARHYGLNAYGAQGEIDALSQLKFPFIVFWKFNHFVVVEDIQEDFVYINNPESGRYSVTMKEFSKAFTGIILVMEPGPHFKKEGLPPSIIRSLKDRFLSSITAINFLILISLALIVPGIIIPGFSKIFIDNILLQGIHNWLPLLLLGICLTAILRAIISAIQRYYLLRLNMKLMITGAAKLLWHVFRLPIAFFEQRYAGDISERLNANDRISTIMSSDVSASVVSLISMVFFGIILFFYDPILASIGLIVAIFNALMLYWTYYHIQEISRKFLQDRGKLAGIEINGLRFIESLKASTLDNAFFRRWSGNHAKIIDTQQKMSLYLMFLTTLPGLLSGLSTIIILSLGSYRVMEGIITIGTLVAFQSLLASFNAPLNTLLGIGTNIQQVPGDIARIEDVMHQAEDLRFSVPDASEKKPNKINTEKKNTQDFSIKMQNVSFGYSTLEAPLIQNLNLNLQKGSQVAIVGATGSGKSTIAKLITGLYRVWEGSIEINGQKINDLSPQSIAKALALVDQDILLYEGTIRDNLTLWNENIPHEELLRATKDACIYDVLRNRPHLFDAHVEEGGGNFSGGERQRLEIARALVNQAKILIMDEGTSALDAITEKKIIENLKSQDYSLLLITHRLSTIRDSDEIIVLDFGRVLERGTHDQLLEKKGHYAELIANAS